MASSSTSSSSAPRRPSKALRIDRRKALVAFAIVVVVAALSAGTAWVLSYNDTATDGPKLAAPTTPTSAPPAPVSGSLIATTKVDQLTAWSQPDEASPVVTKLSNITEYGVPRTLLITEQQSPWLHVLLPIRPNGSSGWIRESDVTLSSTTLRIDINLTQKYLLFTDGGVKILDTAVAIGKDETPTPPGTYYITDPVDLTSRPNGAYGAFALGISGFSNVLTSFRGGPGQLAVHGTANPSDIGQKISNGCVRIPNAAILEMAKRVPLGTPVVITA